jgi:hypothetical protein
MGGEALGVARRIARQIDRECVSEARLGVERLKHRTLRQIDSSNARHRCPPGLNGSEEVVHSNSTNGALHQTWQGTSAVGNFRTCQAAPTMSTLEGKADHPVARSDFSV